MNPSAGRDVRFGFLGAGMIARSRLAPAVHAADGATLHTVAARDGDRARALEPVGRVHSGAADQAYAAVLDDPEVDAVYISLANDAHVPWTIRALESGKHVLCEKPLALDAAQAATAFAAARAADRLLVEAFFYRWHPRVRWAEQLVAAGELGDIVRVDSAFCFAGDWTAPGAPNYRMDGTRGGGALYDVAVYPVSVARWALPGFGDTRTVGQDPGDPSEVVVVESVGVSWSASLTPPGGPEVDMRTQARLRNPAGGVADIRAAITGYDEQSATLTGTTAILTLDSPAFTARDTECSVTISDPAGGLAPGVEVFPPTDPYRLMVEAVAARIRGEDAFVVPPEDSMAIARVCDAIRAAMH